MAAGEAVEVAVVWREMLVAAVAKTAQLQGCFVFVPEARRLKEMRLLSRAGEQQWEECEQ